MLSVGWKDEKFGSISVSGQLPIYPSPNPTLTLTCDQFGLGEGQVGSCPDTDIDPKVRPGDQVKVADHKEDTAKISNLELLSNSNKNGCYLN